MLSRRAKTGETTARPQCGHVRPKLADLPAAIRQQVTTRPDATLAELRAWLLETHEVSASEGLLCKTLAERGLTLKKVAPRPNKTALTSLRHGRSGARSSLSLTPAS